MSEIILSHNDVLSMLPDRVSDSHKGNYGKILLLCGSMGYTGAPALAAMGALRSGAGLVFLGVPASIYQIEAIKLTEPIVLSLPDTDGKLNKAAVSVITSLLDTMDALLIGPGLGKSDAVSELVHTVLKEYSGPVVLDADGINLMALHKDILRGRTGPTILTPHTGEFQRLGGNIHLPRISSAVELANEFRAVVVLKGHRTVITDGSTIYVNPTGNPGMSVGGSGDVLAGMVTAFLGQGIAPLESAAAACWLRRW